MSWPKAELGSHLKCSLNAAAAKSLQSCLTLCNPIDSSPLGSSVHGIFQARVLELGSGGHSMLDTDISA